MLITDHEEALRYIKSEEPISSNQIKENIHPETIKYIQRYISPPWMINSSNKKSHKSSLGNKLLSLFNQHIFRH